MSYPDPDHGSNPTKRIRLINNIREACAKNGGETVIPFCDEAQRYDDNEYEWLRDVHGHLDRLQIMLFTILVGQQDLLSIKIAMQCAGKTQIVARLMVDELTFFGVRNAADVAICLAGYGAAWLDGQRHSPNRGRTPLAVRPRLGVSVNSIPS